MKKIFIFLIGFIMLPCSVQTLSYYDSAKSYTIDSPEIQEAISEMQYEQKVQNVSPKTDKSVDIVVFAGQSNMKGKDKEGASSIPSITNAGYEMRYNFKDEAVGVKYLKDSIDLKNSLIPAFANSYYNNTGVPIIAIQTAVSGSSINSWQEGDKYYETAIKKMKSAIDYVKNHPNNFSLRNVYFVWYQGEADKPNLDYEKKLKNLFTNAKKDGVDANFMIRIGHLYKASSTKNDDIQEQKFNRYSNMIKLQTEFARKSDLAV